MRDRRHNIKVDMSEGPHIEIAPACRPETPDVRAAREAQRALERAREAVAARLGHNGWTGTPGAVS